MSPSHSPLAATPSNPHAANHPSLAIFKQVFRHPHDHRKSRSDSMTVGNAATSDPPKMAGLQTFIGLLKTRQSADLKRIVEDFPRFMVRCFLKDSPSSGSGHVQPFHGQLFSQKFPLDKETWDFMQNLDCAPDSRCRFSFQPSDPLQNATIENIKRYNALNSQLTRPPELALEEHIKPQDISAIDLFLVCFCSGLREAYCLEGGCPLIMKFQKDSKNSGSIPDVQFDFAAQCRQMKPLPDSISCDPSIYLKPFMDNFLKPNVGDSIEVRSYKERAFARLCSLLIWVFKNAKHTTADDSGILSIRQNALLVPLCFLPFVSIVCHKMLSVDAQSNRSFPCLTDQSDNRRAPYARPRHSLIGYSAVIPKRPDFKMKKEADDSDSSLETDLWKRFLPSVTSDDSSFPPPFFHFTKMSSANAKYWKQHSDYSEGRYISILSHYVHLLLEAVRSDYPNKKNMYSVQFDNLICNIWASTMFPWMITQKPAEPEFDQMNAPFRRDFEKIRCQTVPYLYDDFNSKNPWDPKNNSNQIHTYDYPERFSLSFGDEIHEFFHKQIMNILLKCQAQAAKRNSPAQCSRLTILLLMLFFSLPWMGIAAFYFILAVCAFLFAYISIVAYFLWQHSSAPQANAFSQMIRESTDAFFLHRWATVRVVWLYCIRLCFGFFISIFLHDYSQWTMKSEHNLLASQAMFFEYLSRRLKEDAQDLKGALSQSGCIQWIDTLECIFHDSTASLNWVCCADSTFLKRSFSEVFEHASQSLDHPFVPTIVCIIPDEHAQRELCHTRSSEKLPRLQEFSSFFRHHIRVGIIAESHFNRKQNLLDQVTDLTPFLKLFGFQPKSHQQYDAEFDRTMESVKKIFGDKLDTAKTKTLAIIPAVSIKKPRQFMLDPSSSTYLSASSTDRYRLISSRSLNPSDDLLNALVKNVKDSVQHQGRFFVVIGLKNSTGKVAMACVDLMDINSHSEEISCDNCLVRDRQGLPVKDFSLWCKPHVDVFLYAIHSTELFLDLKDRFNLQDGFEFAQCLCSASRPCATPLTKERFQTIVKQGHSFSDKLTFKISSLTSQSWNLFLDVRNKHSHEYIISDSSGKQLPLQSLRSPWVSRPAFPRPTLGSPFFLIFLMSKPGCKPGRPGEYVMDLRKEDFDLFSKSLRQLGAAMDDIRKNTVSKLDIDILKRNSFLFFKWHQFVNSMPWIGYERIPPRDVLFRSRACASTLKDVAWWLSSAEITQSSSIVKSAASNISLQSSVTSSINDEVKHLNHEVSYLMRLQKLTEVTMLHLKMCRSALEQCIKVHNDEHLGHVQLWELLDQLRQRADLNAADRSRLKHICRQYLEKVSNLFLLAGIPVNVKQSSAVFDTISKGLPRIKYAAFRDQMMYHFKDCWGTNGNIWTDAIHPKDTSTCCVGFADFSALSSDWTKDCGILLQDVLGRLHDHSIDLFLPPNPPSPNHPDPIRQAGILKLINSFKGSQEFTTLIAALPGWDCTSTKNRSFLNFPDISRDIPMSSFSTPFEFLDYLCRILQATHDSPNFALRTETSPLSLQDAILFMGERDVDGKDSSSPGILQILHYEWTGIPYGDRQPKPGLAGDLETIHRLAEQRLKTCHSKILTLTGKQKRAQLIRDDPSYRQSHAPPDAVRLLLWRALDWYSHRFNDCWGFPTSCLIDGPTKSEEGICHAIHSNHRYLSFYPKAIADNISRDYPNCDKVLFAAYIGILPIWSHMFSLKLDLWFISFSLLFFMMIALVHNRGKVNLPYMLAKLSFIDRHDVHHGIDLAAWTNFFFFSILAVAGLWYLGIVPIGSTVAAVAVVLPLIMFCLIQV